MKKKTTRKLSQLAKIDNWSMLNYHGERICYLLVQPINVSVVSADAMEQRIRLLMDSMKDIKDAELLCLNSRESFESNKQFLRKRLAEETMPVVRELLKQDIRYLDEVQAKTATSREFAVALRMRNVDERVIQNRALHAERVLHDHQFRVRRADAEDIKRILAVAFEQNVTSTVFEDYDGERMAM